MFDAKFSGMIPFMNSMCPKDFEVSFEEVKRVLFYSDTVSSTFGPLSLGFTYRIMAHIISTTLIPRKGSLGNITYHVMFVMYYLMKSIR